MDTDFKVRVEGSIWLFEPLTEAAKEFTSNLGLEGWRWMGNSFGIDARPANNLVTALEEEGFVLEIQ